MQTNEVVNELKRCHNVRCTEAGIGGTEEEVIVDTALEETSVGI